MPVTKYDLSAMVNSYFVSVNQSPKHTVTPELCDQFAYNVYSLIVSIPIDEQAYTKLLNYVSGMADYLGIDINKAKKFLQQVPLQDLFLQYIKDHYRIETNGEIIKRMTTGAFQFIGETIGSSLWALLKPLLPFLIIGLVIVMAPALRKSA